MSKPPTSLPRATMRLQLHRGFSFADAARLAPYLGRLGVSHMYTSPILAARAGSMHGYDVIDPTRLNPELGGEDGFRRMVAALRAEHLGLLVDIVPNHMAASLDNAWWVDALRLGQASRYAKFFDIDWHPADPAMHGKLLLPILGQPYAETLAAGELRLERDAAAGRCVLRYFDHVLPLSPPTEQTQPSEFDADSEAGRARLDWLLQQQNYRLAWWRVAADEINWRRFFDINDLVAMRVEDDEVFEATHATLFRLYAEGMIDGLRVDHVDGLTDPGGYCRRLRARLAELAEQRPLGVPEGPAYLVVEKILGRDEALPKDWQVDGTTGYDFMDAVNLLQHDAKGAAPLARQWAEIAGRPAAFADEETEARREIIEHGFSAQLDAVTAALHDAVRGEAANRDLSRAALRRAVLALLAHFPVYRIYEPNSPQTRSVIARALDGARRDMRGDATALELVAEWLIDPPDDARRLAAIRFQQLSAPVAAKAVEDTAFYRYGRLLSRNDVGFDAALFAGDVAKFHAGCQARAVDFPRAMLATATHDHKRGEDLRARLAVLSEMPGTWKEHVSHWRHLNAAHRRSLDGAPVPSPGDEAMLYQMIVGAWPTTLSVGDRAGCAELAERLVGWQVKAMREAKLATDWSNPNAAYEDGAARFLRSILTSGSVFALQMSRLAHRIGPAGAVNGLAQTLLKLTVPGMPDFYQGTEFWDQSLVDPDNRRPVDFAARIAALEHRFNFRDTKAAWRDGRIKQALIARVLELRGRNPALFARGTYWPIEGAGPAAEHVVAFARRLDAAVMLVVVPRLPYRLLAADDTIAVPERAWQGTNLLLPPELAGLTLHDALTGATASPCDARLPVAEILARCPVSVLTGTL